MCSSLNPAKPSALTSDTRIPVVICAQIRTAKMCSLNGEWAVNVLLLQMIFFLAETMMVTKMNRGPDYLACFFIPCRVWCDRLLATVHSFSWKSLRLKASVGVYEGSFAHLQADDKLWDSANELRITIMHGAVGVCHLKTVCMHASTLLQRCGIIYCCWITYDAKQWKSLVHSVHSVCLSCVHM